MREFSQFLKLCEGKLKTARTYWSTFISSEIIVSALYSSFQSWVGVFSGKYFIKNVSVGSVIVGYFRYRNTIQIFINPQSKKWNLTLGIIWNSEHYVSSLPLDKFYSKISKTRDIKYMSNYNRKCWKWYWMMRRHINTKKLSNSSKGLLKCVLQRNQNS